MKAAREILVVIGAASTLTGLAGVDWRLAAVCGGAALCAVMLWAMRGAG